mgnify:CR=1 FL=1
MLMMVMEIYTVGVSMIGILTSNSIVFIANFVIAFTGALASGLSLYTCLLYTSDAADDLLCVDLGGRRIIKKNKNTINYKNY